METGRQRRGGERGLRWRQRDRGRGGERRLRWRQRDRGEEERGG